MQTIYKKYGCKSVFALTRAEDIWRGIEACLYSNGEELHFMKHGSFPVIRAKQSYSAIRITVEDDRLLFKCDGFTFRMKPGDRWQNEEERAIVNAIKNNDNYFKPCFASIKIEEIKGRLRMFIRVTVTGLPLPKYDKHNNIKHPLGMGRVGCDIGTQTFAYASESKVDLKILSLLDDQSNKSEKLEARLLAKMDRSLRAMNPGNYNPDGTVKKGRHKWVKSNNYKRLAARVRRLRRTNAVNRKYAANRDANKLRELGNTFITEPKNASKLAKKAKRDESNPNKRRRRFGRSIQKRCPGYFQETVKNRFERTGGHYLEVPNDYKASQYDHTADKFIKKTLNTRMYDLSNGTTVQRDMYSAFLLSNCDLENLVIDRNLCLASFNNFRDMMNDAISYIAINNIKMPNSGIETA